MNIFTDKYFTRAKEVAIANDMYPKVKYRVFGRFDGLAALDPAKMMIQQIATNAVVKTLPVGTPFKAGDTIMTVEDTFEDIVELETMYLQWCALPCYCAYNAKQIVDTAFPKEVMDFSARHLFGAESVALASYGASVGGMKKFSTDIGANAEALLIHNVELYKYMLQHSSLVTEGWKGKGIGTIPHALIALFHGDYVKCAEAYKQAFPDEKQIHLIDYNNHEIDDSLALLMLLGEDLKAVRIDTCGENHSQAVLPTEGTGVCTSAVKLLREALDTNGGKHVKIVVSSGFDYHKTNTFMKKVPSTFDMVGTGSFIPKVPQCTSDIYEVDGKEECKKGREWGFEANIFFNERCKFRKVK
jgi:nicotinate phosphoribosyltransferase